MALTAAFLDIVRAPASGGPVRAASGAGFAAVLRDVSAAPVLPIAARAQPGVVARALLPVTQTGLPAQLHGASRPGISAAQPDVKTAPARLIRPQPVIMANAGSVPASRNLAGPAGEVAAPSAAPVLPVQQKAGSHSPAGLEMPEAQRIGLPADAALGAPAPALARVTVRVSSRDVVTGHATTAEKGTHGAEPLAATPGLFVSQQAPIAAQLQAVPLPAVAVAAAVASKPISGGLTIAQAGVPVAESQAEFGPEAGSLVSPGNGHTSPAVVSGKTLVAPSARPHTAARAHAGAVMPVRAGLGTSSAAPSALDDDVPSDDSPRTGAVAPSAVARPVGSASALLPASVPASTWVPAEAERSTGAGAPAGRDASGSVAGAAAQATQQRQGEVPTIASTLSGNAVTLPAASPLSGAEAQPAAPHQQPPATQAPAYATPETPRQTPPGQQNPAAANAAGRVAYQPALAWAGQTVAAALVAQPATALPAASVGAPERVASAQNSVASTPAPLGEARGTGTRPAARVASVSVQGSVAGFDPSLESDAIAPASLEPSPAVVAAPASKPAPDPAAKMEPAHGESPPASRQAEAPAQSVQPTKVDAAPTPGRPGRPGASDTSDAVATASAAPGLTDAGTVAGPVAAQADIPASGASIGPAQQVAASSDAAAAQTGAQTGAPAVTPAVQLAQAVTSLHAGADGSSHVTIKLDPAELGQVQVRITRAQDGTASVSVAVERPETLASLQGDLGHLHEALDRAGLPEQRSVTLHLAGSDQAGSQTLDAGAGNMSQGGFQQGSRQERQPSASFVPDFSGGAQPVSASGEAAPLSRPAATSAVNITA